MQVHYHATLRSMVGTIVNIMAVGNLQEMEICFNMVVLSNDHKIF